MAALSLNSIAASTQDTPDNKTAAQQTITISTHEIDGLIGTSSDARYNRLFEKVANELDVPLSILSIPGNRLERHFHQLKTGCIFPEYRAPANKTFLRSVAFNQATVHLVTLKAFAPNLHVDIDNLTIGLVNGYNYDFLDLSKAKSVAGVETEAQNLQLLLFNRVEAIVSYFPDLPLAASDAQMEQISYDPNHALFVYAEKIACFDTPLNRLFLVKFKDVVALMAANGDLAEMLAPYYYGLPDTN